MQAMRTLAGALLAVAMLCGGAAAAASAPGAPVVVVPVEGAIGPAVADFVHKSLERAARDGARLVVLKIDTPGGLDTSMRAIIKDILASPVPVAGWVAPGGARAASAGTFILYACHFAAMAPATNLGAASPVSIGGAPPSAPKPGAGGKKEEKGEGGAKGGDAISDPAGTMTRKVTHDAAAYIRSLAQLRGRNADWGERAVREAVSLPAEEAVKLKVIDFVAADEAALLEKIDGRTTKIGGAERTMQVKGAETVTHAPDWRTRVLSVITNPSVAYLLVLIGIYALIFEFSNPGLVLPGVAGAICLLVAMYAFQLLPVNYAGLALIVLGIGFMVAEMFLPAFGSLGIGGAIAFVIGSIILIDSDLPEFRIPYTLIGGVVVGTLAFVVLVVGMVMKGLARPTVSGREFLVGAPAEALEDFVGGEGWARVRGERWRVRAEGEVRQGERLTVRAIKGLVLDASRDGAAGPAAEAREG